MTNPEQAVLDAIDGLEQDEIGELVRWQLEEGVRRGDGPTSSDSRTDTPAGTIMGGLIAFYEGVSDQFSRRYHLPTDAAEVTARHLRDDPRLAGIPIHTTEPGSSSSD